MDPPRALKRYDAVGSKKLEYGPGMMYAGFPSSLGVGVGGQSYSNFWFLLYSNPSKPHAYCATGAFGQAGQQPMQDELKAVCIGLKYSMFQVSSAKSYERYGWATFMSNTGCPLANN